MTDILSQPDTGSHARLSPSAASRWGTCTASIMMQEAVKPPETSSAFADEGTRLHGIMEQAAGNKWKLPGGLAGEDEEACARALELLHRMIPGEKEYSVQAEQQVRVLTGPLDTFGTCDLILTAPDNSHVVVVDWKFGRGIPVDAIENRQLALYMMGAWQALGDARHACKRLSAVIIQPRIASSQGEPAVRWDADVREVLAIIDPLIKAAQEMRNGIYKYRPSQVACRWCPSKGYCPAVANMIQKAVDDTDGGLDEKVAELPKEELAKLFRACVIAESVKEAVQRRVMTLDDQGVQLDEIKATDGRAGNRTWGDADKVDELLRQFNPERYAKGGYHQKPKLKSPPQIEKAFAKEFGIVKSMVVRPDGKRTVKLHEKTLREVVEQKRRTAEANRLAAQLDGVDPNPNYKDKDKPDENNPYDQFVNL